MSGMHRSFVGLRLRFLRMEPTHMRQRRGSLTPHGNQFRGDRNCNLFRSNSADVEANRRMHAIEKIGGATLTLKSLRNLDYLALRSDHADVARPRLQRPTQNTHVIAMPASNNHNVRPFI